MNKKDARRHAQSILFNHKDDVAILEQRLARLDAVRSHGSFGKSPSEITEQAGQASVQHIDSVPWWFQQVDALERSIKQLALSVRPIQRLLDDLREINSPLLTVYKLRYEQKLRGTVAEARAEAEYNVPARTFWRENNKLLDMAVKRLDISWQ